MTDEELYNLERQEFLGDVRELCLYKEEMTILGLAISKRFDVTICSKEMFDCKEVRNMWEILESNSFQVEEKDLYGTYRGSREYYIQPMRFTGIAKELASNVTEVEIKQIIDRLKKYQKVRKLCDEQTYRLDEEDRRRFKNVVSLLTRINRIEELSLQQIEEIASSIDSCEMEEIADSSVDLTANLTNFLEREPQQNDIGVSLPFPLLNKAINGLRTGQLIATGMFSNDGKTRLMIYDVVSLVLKHNEKVLIISNEMTEEDIKTCFVTTILNNDGLKELCNNQDISKREIEIRNKNYKDETELADIKRTTKMIEEKFASHVFIIYTNQYSDEDLRKIIISHFAKKGIRYFFYDTLKPEIEKMSNWDSLKATGTVLSELAKTYDICIWGNIQLIETSKDKPQPLEVNSSNIANGKQIYHVLDTLLLFSPIQKSKEEYVYWTSSDLPSDEELQELDINKQYYTCVVAKNRVYKKPNLLFEVDLDRNVWKEVGRVKYKNKGKK